MGADGVPLVHDISERGPAERNGCIAHNDRVVTINDVQTLGKSFAQVADMLNGSMGTSVQLELVASSGDEQPKRIMLRRTWVTPPPLLTPSPTLLIPPEAPRQLCHETCRGR